MYYNYIKAVHVVGVVSWMAGLFYIVRLFIYHTEAAAKPEPDRTILSEQFKIMEQRLWNVITTPAMILTVITGSYMMIDYEWYRQPWMMVKFTLVTGLLVYHFICQKMVREMKRNSFNWTSYQLRLWNELATLFLVAIVFTVILKNAVNWIWGTAGFIVFGIVVMMGVKVYKGSRGK